MSVPPPEVLDQLLSASDAESFATAWTAFLDAHSKLILHVAESIGRDHDAVMDRYAFVLEALQQDDCARLRAYVADGQGKFTTWLIVVVRRLCFDQHRHRYGRRQADSERSGERHLQRRHLTDLVGGELGLALVETAPEDAPDEALRRRELRKALEVALAALEPADRLLLRLRFEDDLSVPEIARLQGETSPFPMYRRLEKVLAAVRRGLQAVGVEDAVP